MCARAVVSRSSSFVSVDSVHWDMCMCVCVCACVQVCNMGYVYVCVLLLMIVSCGCWDPPHYLPVYIIPETGFDVFLLCVFVCVSARAHAWVFCVMGLCERQDVPLRTPTHVFRRPAPHKI